MAGALRKVSQNYNWTIKRAQNDVHHDIIKPQPHSQPTSPSFQDTKPGGLSVLPWDSNRLHLKFKNDYEELREHLESASLILFSWAVTLYHLRTTATRHFINHPIRSVVVLYEESGSLSRLCINPTASIWGLLVTLSRLVAPFINCWFWEIFGAFLPIHTPQASTGEKTDTSFIPQLVVHTAAAEEPGLERAPQVSNGSDVQAPLVNGHTSYDTSDATLPLPAMLVANDLKVGNETVPIVTHDEANRFSLRKSRSHNGFESDNERKVRPGLITRGSYDANSRQSSPKSPGFVEA